VEPDRVLAATYKKALEAEGFTVTPCASAQAAIFASDQQKPDLVIIEIQLVEHSGIEFLYELRSYPEWQDIPVVIHSQVPPAEFSSQAQLLKDNLGVKDYLYKPLSTLADLIKVANRHTKVSV
jgi:DNA-binding response OmpR family regulator